MRFLLPILVLLTSAAGAARAATFCGTPQTPLLEVMSSFVAIVPRPLPGRAQETDVAAFISRGNTAVVSQRHWEIDLGDGVRRHDSTEIERGTASPAAFRDLAAALQAMRAGFQTSCYVNGGGFGFSYDVTWHGWRTNRFVLSSVDSTLPACSPEAAAFVDVVVRYLADLAAAPTTEKLTVAPR